MFFNSKNLFFTSDCHFCHGNIIKYLNRPFLSDNEKEILNKIKESNDEYAYKKFRVSAESLNNMDNTIFNSINNTVPENGQLFILGDFAFTRDHISASRIRNRIKCKNIIFIYGNHDNSNILSGLFNNVFHILEINADGQAITLCHYPMLRWNESHRGSWQLFGHSHGTLNGWIDNNLPTMKMLEVSPDSRYLIQPEVPFGTPWSFEEIRAYMSKRTGEDVTFKYDKKNEPWKFKEK